MVEVSHPLIEVGVSNSPVSSSLFTTFRYGMTLVAECPFWCYPPTLFLSHDKFLKNFLVLIHLFDVLH